MTLKEVESAKINEWLLHVDPDIPERQKRAYFGVVRELTRMITPSRFSAISRKPLACFEAVSVWKRLQSTFPEFQFGDAWLSVDPQVQDVFGYLEGEQNVLLISMDGSDRHLLVDVACYLFGFTYKTMPFVIGDKKFIGQTMTNLYSQKYPSVPLRVAWVSNSLDK